MVNFMVIDLYLNKAFFKEHAIISQNSININS